MVDVKMTGRLFSIDHTGRTTGASLQELRATPMMSLVIEQLAQAELH
jgi:hypothetical protein